MEEVEKWFEKGKKDLDDAEFNFINERFEVAAFLAHQAAEKALKALYILKFKKLWKIHDLVELAKTLNAPFEILEACDLLNPHYIATRYVIDVVYTREMAEEALGNAKKVIKWVESMLKK